MGLLNIVKHEMSTTDTTTNTIADAITDTTINTINTTNGFYELKHIEDYNEHKLSHDDQTNILNILDENNDIQKSQAEVENQNINKSSVDENAENNCQNVDDKNKNDTNHTDSDLVSTSTSMEIVENIKIPPGLEHMTQQLNNSNGPTNLQIPVGDILKDKFIEYEIIPTCLVKIFIYINSCMI